MAKQAQRKSAPRAADTPAATGKQERGAKTAAVRAYLKKHRKAMPKEVVAVLKEQQGIDVSPNTVSVIKAKMGIKRAKRKARQAAAANLPTAAAQASNVAGLDAALTLYKAASGQQQVPRKTIREAFLMLVEALG